MRFLKATFSLLVATLTLIALFSCGGGGGHPSGTPELSAFRGVYRSAFNRSISPNTELVIGVNDDGATRAVLSDINGILFIGSGQTMKDGSFNVLAAPPTNVGNASPAIQQVSIAATFYTEGFSATLAGAINETLGGPQYQEPLTTCPFQGRLTGEFSGGDSGTLHLLVNPHGITTGGADSAAGEFLLDGQTNNDGSLTFHAARLDGGITWKGYVFILPGKFVMKGSGTWTSKFGKTGTWEASGQLLIK